MNKINFVNNSEPALSAENLNQMQNNMEEVGVAVSPTEPTTGEKVWIQKGKNLFKDSLVNGLGNTEYNNGTVIQKTADTNPNPNWKLTGYNNYDYVTAITSFTPSLGRNGLTFVKKSNFNNLQLGVNGSQTDTVIFISVGDLIDGETYAISFNVLNTTQGSISWKDIQIEQGSTATEYEEYIDRKINVENSEFLNVETMGIETITNENGTAIKYPDGTLICKGYIRFPANTAGLEIPFPMEFKTNNLTEITVCITNVFANSNAIMWTGQANSTSMLGLYPVDILSKATPTVDCIANYIAIGRWK